MSRKRVELYEDVLKDGRCQYRLPYIDKVTGKHKTLSIILDKQTNSNYKLALRTLQDKLDAIMLNADQRNPTLSEIAELYLADRKSQIKASTYVRNKQSINQSVEWLGADVRLQHLTVPYIRKVFTEQCPKPVTYNEYLKRFKTMLVWAYENDYLDDRKLYDKLKYIPDNKRERIEDKYLEREELHRLLDQASNKYWQLVIRFLALSGLRVGELMSLMDSDIDQEYIHINTTYDLHSNKITTPKTEGSIRDVYLRPELSECVKDIRSYMRVYKFEKGIKSKLFLCWEDGSYLHYDAFRKYLGELSEKALDHRITPHALRHTATSLLVAEGVPLDVVSRQLGHVNSRITQKIYLHITQELKMRDNEILKKASVL